MMKRLLLFFTAFGAFLLLIASCARTSVPLRAATVEEVAEVQPMRLLILGKDRSAGLTDSMMLLCIDPAQGSAAALQIPRDTYAAYTARDYRKLNGALSVLGARGTCDFLSKHLGVPLDGYVVLDLEAVRSIVDAVGGVDVELEMPLQYSDPDAGLEISLPRGRVHLDGARAEQFVRFRSGYANADLGRLDAQKRFLRAFAGRISELSLYRKSEILLSVAHRIETDLSVAELLQLCRTTSALPLANADMETLPGEAVRGVSGAWYYSISKEAAIASIARTMHLDAGALAQRFDPEGVFDRREHPDFHNIYTAPAMTDADPRGILYGSGEERIGSMEELMTNMLPSLEQAEPEELAHAIFDILDAKKAQQLRVLRVHDETVIADYFVLCTGNSSTQVKSLGGEVEYKLGLRGVDPLHFEGRDNNSWVVLDYGSVIVHVFSREAREFYNLDKLYSDSKEIVYEGIDEKAAKETEKQ